MSSKQKAEGRVNLWYTVDGRDYPIGEVSNVQINGSRLHHPQPVIFDNGDGSYTSYSLAPARKATINECHPDGNRKTRRRRAALSRRKN